MTPDVAKCGCLQSGLLQDGRYFKMSRKLKFWNLLSSEIWGLVGTSFNGYWNGAASFHLPKAASRSCNILLALFEPCTDCKAMEQVLVSHVFTSFWHLMWSLLILFLPSLNIYESLTRVWKVRDHNFTGELSRNEVDDIDGFKFCDYEGDLTI